MFLLNLTHVVLEQIMLGLEPQKSIFLKDRNLDFRVHKNFEPLSQI